MAAADVSTQRSAAARPRPAYAGLAQSANAPASPHTPLLSRSISSQFGSPSLHRIEDEHVILEIGARLLRVGFAGDHAPSYIQGFGPDTNSRLGDYDSLDFDHAGGQDFAKTGTQTDIELWDYEVPSLDLSLVQDKLERALRTAFEKHLLLDIKARSAIVALPPALPNPLIEIILKTIFGLNNHPKSVYLASSPILCAIGGGVRSALVVDIGWQETTVTAVYEYREVSQHRSIRAGRLVNYHARTILSSPHFIDNNSTSPSKANPKGLDLESQLSGILWCRERDSGTLLQATVLSNTSETGSGKPLSLDFQTLADPAEALFSARSGPRGLTDDHDTPLHLLVWRSLLALSPDVRGICMSRIIFSGGCSAIPGIKRRALQEVEALVNAHGWDKVTRERQFRREAVPPNDASKEHSGDRDPSEIDEISQRLESQFLQKPRPLMGKLRCVDSLGAWAGASIMGHLRTEASIEIKREEFVKHGMNILGYPIR